MAVSNNFHFRVYKRRNGGEFSILLSFSLSSNFGYDLLYIALSPFDFKLVRVSVKFVAYLGCFHSIFEFRRLWLYIF